MARLKLALLGPFEATLDDVRLTGFRSNKTRALLAYLAMEANRPLHREALVSLLWGESGEKDARASLRSSLSNLRQILSPLLPAQDKNAPDQERENNPVLPITRQRVQLNTASKACWVDTITFEALLDACRTHSHHHVARCPTCIGRLSRAIELCRGDFLSDLILSGCPSFDDWRLLRQENFHRQALTTLEMLNSYYAARRDYDRVQHFAWKQIELEPWREEAHRYLMWALALQGKRSAALTQYQTCFRILAEKLGVAPTAETMTLQEKIVAERLKPEDIADPISPQIERQLLAERRLAIQARLEPLGQQRLFGVDHFRRQLLALTNEQGSPWLIALEGLGGLGKTSLADRLVRDVMKTGRFTNIAWVSAKQQTFVPATGIEPASGAAGRPALDEQTLIDTLLEQLDPDQPRSIPPQEKRIALTRLLKEGAYLAVIDNLETAADYRALLPTLRSLANPAKFLLTGRYSLRGHSDIFALNLTELERPAAIAMLKHEAQVRGLRSVLNASEVQLHGIYRVVGGNPLALKLVLGQIHALPLSQVLENLKQAQGKQVSELFTYIYWHTWQALSLEGQQALLSMTMAGPRGTNFTHLAAVSGLEPLPLSQALTELAAFSVLEVGGTLEERHYLIHRLTETFLLTEITHWPPPL